MEVAALLSDRAGLQQPAVELVPIGEAIWSHAGGRAHRVGGLFREGHVERAVLAPEEAGGGERLELLALAKVEALADVDERRHRWIHRTERARDPRAEVRGRHRLRRHVAGVPIVLVA